MEYISIDNILNICSENFGGLSILSLSFLSINLKKGVNITQK